MLRSTLLHLLVFPRAVEGISSTVLHVRPPLGPVRSLPPATFTPSGDSRLALPSCSATGKPAEEQPLPKSVLPISLSVFAQMIGEGIAISSLPLHMRSLGATSTQVGMATSAFSVAQLVCCPLLVSASSRIGRKTILRVCLAGASVAQLIIALSSTATGVLVGRFLGGVFAASVPVAQAGVTDLVEPSQSALALSRVSAAGQLGVVVGPSFSAIAAAAFAYLGVPAANGMQMRGVFIASAAFASVVLVVTGVAPPVTAATAVATAAPAATAAVTAAAREPPGAAEADATAKTDAASALPIAQGSRRLANSLPYSSSATQASARLH
jgi:MFS family permease